MFMSHPVGVIISITICALLTFWGITEFLYLDITGMGRRKAFREFPKAANKFGFTRKKGKTSTFTGVYDGYSFTIHPKRNATIHLQMKSVPGLKEFITREGETNFSSGDQGFDNLFRTRLVSHQLGQKLSSAKPFIAFAVQFGRRWKSKSNYIQIYNDSIYCSLKYGNGSYIPASVLRQIVPDMVKLANLLRAAVKMEN